MQAGTVKEIKAHEYRVGLTPMSEIAVGIGADVTILDIDARCLAYLDEAIS